MAGQMIILPGATYDIPTDARINMTPADMIAARMPYLQHAVSARTLINTAQGAVGRCRATGKLVSASGTSPGNMQQITLGGKPAIGMSAGTGQAAFDLPAGSWRDNQILVASVYIGANSFSGADLTSVISGADPTPESSTNNFYVRLYGGGYSGTNAGYCVNTLNTSGGTASRVLMPSSGWAIVASYNNTVAKQTGISVNGGEFNKFNFPTVGVTTSADSYLRLGFPNSPSGLRDSGVGDMYVFGSTVIENQYGMNAISALISALKNQYGIS